MASTALLGFLKGASAQGLDSIKARQAAEAEERKAKLLAQLRLDTEKEMALFTEELPSTKQKRELERKQDERADRKAELDEKKFGLDEMTTKQAMELARNKDAREGQLTGAQVGYYNRRGLDEGSSGGGSEEGGIDEYTVANELMDKFKGVLPPDVPADVIHKRALASIRSALRSAGSPQERLKNAQDRFLFQLEDLKKDVIPEEPEYGKAQYAPSQRINFIGGRLPLGG